MNTAWSNISSRIHKRYEFPPYTAIRVQKDHSHLNYPVMTKREQTCRLDVNNTDRLSCHEMERRISMTRGHLCVVQQISQLLLS